MRPILIVCALLLGDEATLRRALSLLYAACGKRYPPVPIRYAPLLIAFIPSLLDIIASWISR